jgi:hypothetical protein
MPYVLDSTKFVPPESVLKCTPPGASDSCSGIIRYAGTPDLAWKNITPSEQSTYNYVKLPVAHVHERGAGDSLKGKSQGKLDAYAMVGDLTRVNANARAAHFVVQDTDFRLFNWKAPVASYVQGLHLVCDPSNLIVSAYGGYDVIKFLFDEGLIKIGWQTKAWSQGRKDPRASLYQQIGYVYPNNVQCDWNEAALDWGQNIVTEASFMADMTDEQVKRLNLAVDQILGSAIPGQLDFKGSLKSISARLDAVNTLVKANDTALAAEITDARTALLMAVASVDVSHLDDEQVSTLATAVSDKINLSPSLILDALKTRLES